LFFNTFQSFISKKPSIYLTLLELLVLIFKLCLFIILGLSMALPFLINTMYRSIFNLVVLVLFFTSCTKSGYQETTVYNNNFINGDITGLEGATWYTFNGTKTIGRYNNGGFTLHLTNLPKHKAIQIELVPYFHNSWDGNNNFGGIDGPDIWDMKVDGQEIVHATFSNSPCEPLYCLFQSYPVRYSTVNNPPMTDAVKTFGGTEDNCSGINTTSMYRIVKTISHTNSAVKISCRDFLVQTNVPNPLCDESWSMASIIVKVINLP